MPSSAVQEKSTTRYSESANQGKSSSRRESSTEDRMSFAPSLIDYLPIDHATKAKSHSAEASHEEAEERRQTVTLIEEFCRSVFRVPGVLSNRRQFVSCSRIFTSTSHLLSKVSTEFSPKCSLVRCPHGILVRLPARPRSRIGLAHSRNLSATAEHQRPRCPIARNSSAQGATGSGACHHRHREVSAPGQSCADRGRMRRGQDLSWLWAQSMCWRMGGPVPRW